MQLKDKVLFITGGAQGFGRAVAEAVLKKGAKVSLADVKVDQGEKSAKELQSSYGQDNVLFVRCDVTDASVFEGAFKSAVSKFGHVDVMCNNAGILDESVWEKEIAVNFQNPEMKASEVRFVSICPSGAKTAILDLNESQIINLTYFKQAIDHNGYCTVEQVVEAFVKAMEDDTLNGALLTVKPKEGVECVKLTVGPASL